MLNRHNVFEVSREGRRLLSLERGAVGRKLRRFLACHGAIEGFIVQSYAFEEGHTPEQLEALEAYAAAQAASQAEFLTNGAIVYRDLVVEPMFALVANRYQLAFDVRIATVPQLRQMVECVTILADSMHEFVTAPNRVALEACPDYVYRGLPCSIQPDEKLWAVSGHDVRSGGGVLEWCYDKADAQSILQSMKRFPRRFLGVKAQSWAQSMARSAQAETV